MRDGILRPELDATVKALIEGKTFEEAAKQCLSQVDPKVVARNRESIIRMAKTELGETLVTPEKLERVKKLEAELKGKAKGKEPPAAPAAPTAPAPAAPTAPAPAAPAEDLGDIE